MYYDYAIIGAGVAGSICAYILSKNGKKCIIFENNSEPTEKICGGGVSYKALTLLEKIGIQTEQLFLKDSQQIIGHCINKDNVSNIKYYNKGKVSLGIQRKIFDGYLMEYALNAGAIVKYGCAVNSLNKNKDLYEIEKYHIKEVIWATGAKNIYGAAIEGQSIGYSGQIYAISRLLPNLFYYWYYEKQNDTKYFWAFPIGKNLWNVGVWSRYPFSSLKNEYENCLCDFFLKTVGGEWQYLRKPKAEFLGHVDQREKNSVFMNGIGDFAGNCNSLNGGGIIGAISSAITFADENT